MRRLHQDGQSDAALFRAGLASFAAGEILIVTHNDADGLAAAAILARGLARRGLASAVRIMQRGESPWSDAFRDEVATRNLAGLIVTDLGVRDRVIREGVATILIDHHVPMGVPPGPLTYQATASTRSRARAFWRCAPSARWPRWTIFSGSRRSG